jgi:hypothetical protein
MNIKQALKRKNILVNEIKQELSKVQTYNSTEVGGNKPYSSKFALEAYNNKTDELIALKVAIHKANAPVYDKIFRLSELKSKVKYINSLNCTEGKEQNRYGASEPRIMVAEIGIVERDLMVKEIEDEINKIQDELDYFNNVTNLPE